MTDEELICTRMESKPDSIPNNAEDMELCGSICQSPHFFWICVGGYGVAYRWVPRKLDLDALHEVEARLTDEQKVGYIGALLLNTYDDLTGTHWRLCNADAPTRIKALSSVLRLEARCQ